MSSYDEIRDEIYTALYKLHYERRQVLFGNPKDFKKWLKNQGVTEQVSKLYNTYFKIF